MNISECIHVRFVFPAVLTPFIKAVVETASRRTRFIHKQYTKSF